MFERRSRVARWFIRLPADRRRPRVAKALDAVGQAAFEDASSTSHDWRGEMRAALIQRPDGSWINDDRRWMEGDANLSTAFSLLWLAYRQPGQ